jgi:hypothetical protein
MPWQCSIKKFGNGSNSAKELLVRPCSAVQQLTELVGRIFGMATISQFGQKGSLADC